MAQRRMFSKSITSSSIFLQMPPTSRLLYYDLGMNADDDGFCEHYTIMKMTDATPDDLKILQARNFIKVFDDKVLIILDWKENNYIQKDRYAPSKYLNVYKDDIKLLRSTNGQPVVDAMYTECIQNGHVGKDRLGKDRKEEEESFSSFKRNEGTGKPKPFYEGLEMRQYKGRWWCIPADGGEWLEFTI